MKLVMTILVKNEADIIENNIRFHADQGVDAFLVMDNNSDDDTPAILERLKNEYDITVVHDESMEYQQAQWMTGLAKQAGRELGADLVISNDADEFWSTRDGSSLKSKLSEKDALVTVHRYNYILTREDVEKPDGYIFCRNKVINPVFYNIGDYLSEKKVILPLQKISPKVIVKPFGLRRIKGGNHRAKHWLSRRKRFSNDIIVEHYPIRSFKQFEKNIRNRQKVIEKHPGKKMSPHYQRWLECLKSGDLENEFRQMTIDNNEVDVLDRFGIIDKQCLSALHRWKQSSGDPN